ncbi:MAG: hypothetical protein LBI53_03710 [Candidatus Peribacteria bacterium]|nr:hypothetical protein [Candidatus Peribacteria bacterium]
MQNSADLRDSYELKTILKRLNQEEGQFKISDLAVNGTILMQVLGIAAGPLVGELLEQTFDWVLTDIPGRNTEKEILTYLKNYLKNRK